MKKPFIMTFKMKALLFMIPVLIVISIIFTYESIQTEKEIIRSEIIKRAETVTTLATKTGELPILSGNPELLKSTVQFLRTNSEVSAVTIYDSRMTMLIHAGSPILNPIVGLLPNAPISMSEEQDAFVFYAPVFTIRNQEDFDIFQETDSVKKIKEQIGWIRLSFSKSSMRETERKIVERGLLLAIFFASGSSILAYFLISHATKPLAQIVKVANGIAHGDLSQEIKIDQNDEIGALSVAFQSMKDTIRQVLRETDWLILAVQAGRLDTRGNSGVFEGGWRNLVDGVNQLIHAFSGAHKQLEEAKEAAEAANRAKSDFLSSMSHELRTPLNAILGYAQIIKRQDNLTDSQRQQLEIMRSSGEHLLMLINDILDVGKIEAHKMEIENVMFDLPALLRQVFNITKLHAEEKELYLRYEDRTPLPEFVRGDERKLKQVLLNLLSNAVKYTRRGGISLVVSYGQAGYGVLRCEVTDTGIGIPTEKLEAIFEPFTQLIGDRQASEGTGLGLNISKRLLALMQGGLGVESVVGEGSTFWMELALPQVLEVAERIEMPDVIVTGYQGKRKSVLVVDDNFTNTSMLVSLLEPLGFNVATAENGRVAVAKALDCHPDLVLMDLVMPEMDGLEAIKGIREHQEVAGVKIIGSSATVTDSDHKEAFVAECDDFVLKPINIDLLLEKIAVLLDIEWDKVSTSMVALEADVERSGRAKEFVVPLPEDIEALFELAMLGDMQRIEKWAAELEERDKIYSGFADKLRDLAGGFKAKAILSLADHYREKGNDSRTTSD